MSRFDDIEKLLQQADKAASPVRHAAVDLQSIRRRADRIRHIQFGTAAVVIVLVFFAAAGGYVKFNEIKKQRRIAALELELKKLRIRTRVAIRLADSMITQQCSSRQPDGFKTDQYQPDMYQPGGAEQGEHQRNGLRRDGLEQDKLRQDERQVAEFRPEPYEDPIEEVQRQVDRTAFYLVYQADYFYKKFKNVESATDLYMQVIKLFPDNRWADVARKRLQDIRERHINNVSLKGDKKC